MGRDRNLPAWFGRIHPARKTPHGAIAGSAVLIAFMAVALPIETVASAANIMFLLLFIQVQAVLIALRRKQPQLRRGFLVPLVPVVPAIGIALQVFLAVYQFVYSPMAWLSAAAWIALGLVVYYSYARRRDRAYGHVVEMREAAERKEYRILACLGEQSRNAPVLEVAGLLARAHDGELIALTVIEVPDGEILARGMDRVGHMQRNLEAWTRGLRASLPLRSLVKLSHRASFAISETVLEEQSNIVVIGRTHGTGILQRFSATMVNRVIREAPAQTLVVSPRSWRPLDLIVYAHEAGPHCRLTADIATAFARESGARLRAVHVVGPEADADEVEKARQALGESLAGRCPDAELRVVRAIDVVSGLLAQARDAALIIIGGTEAGFIEHILGYAIPLELAERAPMPVITVYEMPANPKRWLS
jgi:APA family basic amino acid/polyamine antiporter